MMTQTRIVAVSYLNTIPFIYGIRHEGSLCADLLLTSPSECVQQFIDGDVDIALVPSSAVPQLKSAEIVTDYCVGAESEVRTEQLVSNTPIEEARRIWVDPHSCASVQLAGYLAARVWKIAPEWLPLTDRSLLDTPQDGDAFLLVGDEAFDHEDEFIYTCDLAAVWHEATGLPFAFAVWVARKGIAPEVIDHLEASLELGVERIWEAINESAHRSKEYAYTYLTENIDFLFDYQKRQALELYWDKGRKFVPRANPG